MASTFPRLGQTLSAADGRILIERLRLLHGSMGVSVTAMFPAVILLVWTLINDSNRVPLLLWCFAILASNVYTALDSRRQLKTPPAIERVPYLVRKLMVITAFDGVIWGLLAWGTLSGTNVAGSVFVIAVITGILGGAVSLLSPVMPVFLAFSVPMMTLLVAKLLSLDDPIYQSVAVAAVLYTLTMYSHALKSSQAAMAAIELRFQNVDLVAQAQAARLDAEEANLAKSKFLAAASHDLRQPIHAQGLFLEVLSQTPLTPHQSHVLASARSASMASSDMLNTLLDFSRIEAGVVTPHNAPFDLQTLLNKIENDLAPLADAKGLVYRTRETSLTIHSDAALVEMILRNLVSNAIRYTEPRHTDQGATGGVLIACRLRAGSASVEVWDTGIGIAPQDYASIFKEFHQLGNPERDRRKGLGLGLAIADGLSKTLGHPLTLASQLGRGSVFKLALPLIAASEVIAPQRGVSEPVATGLLHGVRVLVIDDDEAVLLGMAQLLQSWGCKVDTADAVGPALQKAKAQAPDVLISDYRLRGQHTGAQAIDALRNVLGAHAPALMITGDTAPERLREAMSSGVPLLHKPVAPEQLYLAVVELLGEASKTITTDKQAAN